MINSTQIQIQTQTQTEELYMNPFFLLCITPIIFHFLSILLYIPIGLLLGPIIILYDIIIGPIIILYDIINKFLIPSFI